MTDKAPLVSVSLITYNQENFIAESIQSILDQDYPNLEIVIGDDCSQDATWEIISSFQTSHPTKIKAFRNPENLGITGNANEILKRCTGQFVAFTAGDDLFLPGKIRAQVEWFAEDERRVMCGHQVQVFYDGRSQSHQLTPVLTEGEGVRKIIEEGCPYGAVSVMVRRNRIPVSGFDDRSYYCAEYRLWIECIGEDGIYGYVPGIYAKYRRHGNNITSQSELVIADIERLLLGMLEDMPAMADAIKTGLVNQVQVPRARELMKSGSYLKGGLTLAGLYLMNPRRFFRAVVIRFYRYSGIGSKVA